MASNVKIKEKKKSFSNCIKWSKCYLHYLPLYLINFSSDFNFSVGKSVAWRSASPPPSFIDLSSKLKLLDYFVRYMDENLAEGVILSLCANQMRVSTRHRSVIPQVVRWTRNQSAVIMELNNGNMLVF